MHGLPHSFVQAAAEQGVRSREIADAVGDAVATTERHYWHTFERVQEVAAEQVGAAIRRARSGQA